MHTPGPWAIAAEIYIVANPSHDGRVIGNVDRHEFLPEMRAANARLIAAAPDLLAALQALHAAVYEWGESITTRDNTWQEDELLRAERNAYVAISKAEGHNHV